MPIFQLNDNADIDLSRSKVLVVDDQPIHIQQIYDILSGQYTVLAATSGEEALEVCELNTPDLILLDVEMPNMSGIETCKLLKSNMITSEIPVIFVTTFTKQEDENECWQCGGIDLIAKPINPMTVKNRVKAHLTIKLQRDMLLQLVYVDGLTSIYNRRYFDNHLIKIENNAIREHIDNALILIDIDHFKRFNDCYGHVQGDHILKEVAKTIKNTLKRPIDFVARYGGEEFVVLLPNTDLHGALKVAAQINQAIYDLSIEHCGSEHKFITISLGVSTSTVSKQQQRSLVEDADYHLYQAKKQGRNTIASRIDTAQVIKQIYPHA
ncbi:diguanylate cyclase [Pseudoalteromonas tunicata]|jgi:diguanylate cyclase (GGDEF)-like protein|uniref:diguanylate cyclase n=1 Tax=Pseudoalteromonas tunicata D2 TaxID=87626 RepID=A4C8B2_9GAMM|nr:diguanylate cyclase [Pseudoalteromonas tunicata]ATC93332.1 hypothetical protein PTUN_a0555 [Pseudoalteromonas tunicata]AXT32383.1 diguanylate cyclase response regulator [Pseudoalteromonas tunicata]EAR28827.1 putative response regulator [Pseudoalteromonas tunicata D2]